jgi:hypothetical protein
MHFIKTVFPMPLRINGYFPKQQEQDDFVTEMQCVYSAVGIYDLYKTVGEFTLLRQTPWPISVLDGLST